MIIERLKRMQMRLRSRKSPETGRFHFFATGFHGDRYLLELVELILAKSTFFVETGTNVGTTLAHVASRHPQVRCLSCEPDKEAYHHARKNIGNPSNVSLFNETSQSFFRRILADRVVLHNEVLFWLDAHGYGFQWPLLEEIDAITSNWERAYIIIDDFLVPGLDCFAYEQYGEQVCSFEYIKKSLCDKRDYQIYYPAYTDRTSTHHPLVGWCLIEYGHGNEFVLPESLVGRTRKFSFAGQIGRD